MAKHGPNCPCTTCAAKGFWRTGQEYIHGTSSRSRNTSSLGDCPDCGGTGDCPHCNQGFYYRKNGSKAFCGKCRGRLKCHSCRGKGRGGKPCSVARYEEPKRKQGWQAGGSVDGQAAKTKQTGDRLDAIWGGSHGNRPGDGHGHIVSKDGVNAEYLRDPGMPHDDYVVNQDKRNPAGPRRRR